MEKNVLAKCGYRCDLCLAYRPNVETGDRREELSDGWYNIFGFRVTPEKIICDGCVSCGNPRLLDTECPVRPCVIEKGFENCSFCDEYVCEKLSQRLVNPADIEKKLKRKLGEEEFKLFVKPYVSKERLDQLRIKRQ